jgi:hypothetical protein
MKTVVTFPEKPCIRAHEMYKLFTDGRKKGELSETAKKLAHSVIAQSLGKTKKVTSVYLEKGIVVEQPAIDYFNYVFGTDFKKNNKQFISDYMSGTPDIIAENQIIDIKCSYDIETHFDNIVQKEFTKQYYYQLQTYMLLCGFSFANVVYILMPTPEHILQKQARALEYKHVDYESCLNELLEQNETILNLPDYVRIKSFGVLRDKNFVKEFFERYEKFCEYYKFVVEKIKSNQYEINNKTAAHFRS